MFGNAKGVEDINLDIQSGEFFTFLGPSGCGKTTTLRMIAGFYFPHGEKFISTSKMLRHYNLINEI